MPKSLTGRLMLVATIVVLFFLPLAGLVLERAYVASMDSRLEEQLKIQIYSLMGLADELEPGELWLPEALPDERFNQLASGRYAQLLTSSGDRLWRSISATTINLPNQSVVSNQSTRESTAGDFTYARLKSPEDGQLQLAEVTIIWEGPNNTENLYTFQVLENLEPYFFEVDAFRNTLILWLGGLGSLLLLVNLGAMFWALNPFKRLSESILAIESGKTEKLETDYPKELNQIANNINALIVHEREQRRRYRNTLQDLAHSLKTPLSVVTGLIPEISNEELKDSFQEQSERMNRLISYQLQRPIGGGEAPVKQRTHLKPEVVRLAEALEKVYLDKQVQLTVDVSAEVVLFGDTNDILEMLGNLCDNACKYGQRLVTIRAQASNTANIIAVDVIDDGPGIPESQRQAIFERGKRLDEGAEGQGIGLAVVQDIVASYKGEIQWPSIEEGHCVRLLLPGIIEVDQANP